jgi:hypothetical protein
MDSVTYLQLAGVTIQGKQQLEELSLLDLGKITSTLISGKLPLSFDLIIEGLNPNEQAAVLHSFDWILILDNEEVTRGANNQKIVIPGNNGTSQFPLSFELNLLDTFSDKSRESLINLALNIADAGGKPSRIGLKIRPKIYLNDSTPIEYPGYITVSKEFDG